jgi:hypothetical protein
LQQKRPNATTTRPAAAGSTYNTYVGVLSPDGVGVGVGGSGRGVGLGLGAGHLPVR